MSYYLCIHSYNGLVNKICFCFAHKLFCITVMIMFSTGVNKHHRFFGDLILICTEFLKNLIEDGILAVSIKRSLIQQNIEIHARPKLSGSDFDNTFGFSFFNDLEDSLQYLTSQLVMVQFHLTKPEDVLFEEARDETDSGKESVVNSYIISNIARGFAEFRNYLVESNFSLALFKRFFSVF